MDDNLTPRQRRAGLIVDGLLLAFFLAVVGSFFWQVVSYSIWRAAS
ncbi:MAG TPA: hypothetical protein VIL88_17755 [Devosia sp.]|jgi:hypothetical protein